MPPVTGYEVRHPSKAWATKIPMLKSTAKSVMISITALPPGS